ncbi:hypothetical protein HanIR_Chr02g0071771 [Helianthus annuus]|nr:hypothetical protein HanIR_Chr02g0071771 [Helianthus annuus]
MLKSDLNNQTIGVSSRDSLETTSRYFWDRGMACPRLTLPMDGTLPCMFTYLNNLNNIKCNII